MKRCAILLLAAGSMLAAPIFWEHPNVSTNLAEPALPFGAVTDVNLTDLVRESPQNQIWFTGGLVGYFTNEWSAPIWTTTRVEWQFDNIDRGDDVPFLPPGIPSREIPPPVTVINPPPIPNPPVVPPPAIIQPPVGGPPPEVTIVPEPAMWGVLSTSLLAIAAIFGRTKRPSFTR